MASVNLSVGVTHKTGDVASQSCDGCGALHAEPYLEAPDRFHSRTSYYRLVRCRACDLIWLESPPGPNELSEHYGPDYDAFIRRATEKRPAQHWHSATATIHKHKQGGAILDLGCGGGSFLNSLRNPSWELSGVEMSAATAALARERTGASIFVGDILDAPFAPDSFDVITGFQVLEHVYSPSHVMRMVRSWLKPDGILCLSVPNIEAAEARLFRSYWYPLELPRHLFHFTPRSLTYLAEANGLGVREIHARNVSFVEYSSRYLIDGGLHMLGLSRKSLSSSPPPSLGWRIFRKGLRLSVLPAIAGAISLAGSGQIIEAVLQKRSSRV